MSARIIHTSRRSIVISLLISAVFMALGCWCATHGLQPGLALIFVSGMLAGVGVCGSRCDEAPDLTMERVTVVKLAADLDALNARVKKAIK